MFKHNQAVAWCCVQCHLRLLQLSVQISSMSLQGQQVSSQTSAHHYSFPFLFLQAELLLSEEAQERASVSDLKLQLQDLQQQVDEASQVGSLLCAAKVMCAGSAPAQQLARCSCSTSWCTAYHWQQLLAATAIQCTNAVA